MNAKKLLLLVVIGILSRASIFAQLDDLELPAREKIKAQKVAFITEKLQLTVKEAQVFWPVYNEYSEKKDKITSDRREKLKFFHQNQTTLSDKDIEKISDDLVSSRLLEAQLDQEYHQRFKAVLPIAKVVKLYRAEVQFTTHLLKQLRQK